MAQEKGALGTEIVNWMGAIPQGFHGILTHPDEREGYVSKDGGAFSFYEIGDGQDPIEVLGVAKQLHDLTTSPEYVDTERLIYLGNERERLAKPKNTNSTPSQL